MVDLAVAVQSIQFERSALLHRDQTPLISILSKLAVSFPVTNF